METINSAENSKECSRKSSWLHFDYSWIQLVLFVAFSALFFTESLADPDFPWHIKMGEYILDTGQIPLQDPFSYWSGEIPFIGQFILSQYYLAQVFFAVLYKTTGIAGLIVMRSLIMTLVILLCWRILRKNGRFFSYFFACCYTLYILNDFLAFRPQLFTYLFLAILLNLLESFRNSSNTRLLLPLPFIMLVWANIHGGFIYGILVIAIYNFSYLINVPLRGYYIDRLDGQKIKMLTVISLVSVGFSLVNPNGYHAFVYAFNTHAKEMFAHIMEYQSPLAFNFQDFPHVFSKFWCLFPLHFGLVILAFKKRNLILALLVFVPLVLSLEAIRYIPLLAITVAPCFQLLPSQKCNFAQGGIVVVFVLICATVVRAKQISKNIFEFSETDSYPVGVVRFLQDNNISGNIFGSYNKSSFLVLNLYPESKIFHDTRFLSVEKIDLTKNIEGLFDSEADFSNFLCKSYLKKFSSPQRCQFQEGNSNNLADNTSILLDETKTEIIVHETMNIYSGAIYPMVMKVALNESWKLVYADGRVVVFLKDIQKFKNAIAKFALSKEMLFDELIAEGEMGWETKQQPYFYVSLALGYLLKEGSIREEFAPLFHNTTQLMPNSDLAMLVRDTYLLTLKERNETVNRSKHSNSQ